MLTGLMALPIEKILGSIITPPQLVTGTVASIVTSSASRARCAGSSEVNSPRMRPSLTERGAKPVRMRGGSFDGLRYHRRGSRGDLQIANSNSDGKGTAGMGVVAYGTAMRLRLTSGEA